MEFSLTLDNHTKEHLTLKKIHYSFQSTVRVYDCSKIKI